MATVTATPKTGAFNFANLSNAQTGNGASTNIADTGFVLTPAASIVITSAVGATPTVTVAIQGSMDGTNWYALEYTSSTSATTSIGTFTITTATTNAYHLQQFRVYRYVRLSYSANTNVTLTADIYVGG